MQHQPREIKLFTFFIGTNYLILPKERNMLLPVKYVTTCIIGNKAVFLQPKIKIHNEPF